jgi:FkbM family methyltransferase
MAQGFFSLKEFLYLLLPASFESKRNLIPRYDEFLQEEVKREFSSFMTENGSFKLFENEFRGAGYLTEDVAFINEIVAMDQYQARKFLKEDSIVIDAGANIGTFSVWASQIASRGKIYAFEPVGKTFEALRRNTHYYPQVSVENMGLGQSVSQKNIFVNKKSTGGSVFEDSPFYVAGKSDAGQGGTVEEAKITTVDVFVKERNISKIDFIKIDTEGYEGNILKGAKESIAKWKPVIVMSAYHNPNDKKDLPELLKSIYPEYICRLRNDGEEDFVCHPREMNSTV